MDLLKLPNEILIKIASYVSYDDVEGFTLSNKLIHNLSRHVLEIHRQRKQKSEVYLFIDHGKITTKYFSKAEKHHDFDRDKKDWYKEEDDSDYYEDSDTSSEPDDDDDLEDESTSDGINDEKFDELNFPLLHPFRLLKELIDDDEGHGLAAYIKTIYIRGRHVNSVKNLYDDAGYWIDKGDAKALYLHEEIKSFIRPYQHKINAVFEKFEIASNGNDCTSDRWASLVRDGHQGATIGCILAMLPNLVNLNIHHYLDGDTVLAQIIDLRCSSQIGSHKIKGLSNLQDINIHQARYRGIRISKALTRLPSVKNIVIRNACSDWTQGSLSESVKTWSSSIENIDFSGCIIFDDILADLFGRPNALKRLMIEGLYPPRIFQPQEWVVDWLMTHACDTLEHFEMTWACMSYDGHPYEGDYVRSLRDFNALKYLRIPCTAFGPAIRVVTLFQKSCTRTVAIQRLLKELQFNHCWSFCLRHWKRLF